MCYSASQLVSSSNVGVNWSVLIYLTGHEVKATEITKGQILNDNAALFLKEQGCDCEQKLGL